jgi:hydrogenase nickel incorporation protein HypA/HybF
VHELSIAQSIVEIVRQHVPCELEGEVRSIKIALGEHSGVVRESLEFCFEAIVNETPLEGTQLVFERVQVRSECLDCSQAFDNSEMRRTCTFCDSANLRFMSGTELRVVEVEIEE